MKRQALDVLLVEDDGVLGGAVAQRLRLEGLSVLWVQSAAQAIEALQRHDPALMLSDIRLPDGTGEDVFRQAARLLADTEVMFATAYAEVAQAVALVKAGASDYLIKPYDINDLVRRIKATLSRAHLPKGVRTAFRSFHHDSAEMAALMGQLKRLARENFPILLMGETGTGKEMAARLVHEASDRAAAPFIPVSCADISDVALESKYFGHEAGAFPNAVSRKAGVLEDVGGGTLFLDEVCEMHPKMQAALVRVLQDGHFRRLGGDEPIRFEGRIVAATNADVQEALAAGRLRQDLYYRLQGAQLTIPPLRRRVPEILPLAERLLESYGGASPLAPFTLSPAARSALVTHAWPGNVRELGNRIAQACALAESSTLGPADLFPEHKGRDAGEPSLARVRAEAEREEIERVIAESGGRLGEAAKRLGISRTTLWKRRRANGGGA
ncbi:sigma-54 dependent transcriptional regulator [Orrella sp. JC864]|uniref:sigma-54-dependent transcriptional regulator n=1 Tax=Orrella sp. JC864 TaxID=3120298 RepID=UPI00300A601F